MQPQSQRRLIQAEIERWRWEEEQQQAKDWEIRRLQHQLATARDDGFRVAAMPAFQHAVKDAAARLMELWAEPLRDEALKLLGVGRLRGPLGPPWSPQAHLRDDPYGPLRTETLEFSLPAFAYRTIIPTTY